MTKAAVLATAQALLDQLNALPDDPVVVPPTPPVPTAVAPDIVDLVPSSFAAIVTPTYLYKGNKTPQWPLGLMAGVMPSSSTDAGYAACDKFGNAPEFGVDPQVGPFFRCGSFQGATRLISWYHKFSGVDALYMRQIVRADPDVLDGMNELGVKLSAFGRYGGGMAFCIDHMVPKNGVLPLRPYVYSVESGANYGSTYDNQIIGSPALVPGEWAVIDTYAKVNTPGQADGVAWAKLNGVKFWDRIDFNWRNDVAMQFDCVHGQFYHGGMTPPKVPIHYSLARLAASTQVII